MKTETLKDLFVQQPLKTNRIELKILDDENYNAFVEHIIASSGLKNDSELVVMMKEKCREALGFENSLTFTLHLRSTHEYIGYFQLKHIDSSPEIGIDIVEEQQRKGIGYELCSAVTDFLFRETDMTLLHYNCFRGNSASIALAKKLGAEYTDEVVLFEYLKNKSDSATAQDGEFDFDVLHYVIKK